MYQLAFDGLREAVEKSSDVAEFREIFAGMDMTKAQQLWNTVDNTIMDIALEKNHKNIIWDIKREIATALTVGDRFDTMADRLAKSLDGNYKKATLITRTEVHRVREAAHSASAKDLNETLKKGNSGLRYVKKWKTMKDGAVRPQSRYKTKKGWKTGKRRPGAPDHMKMHNVVVLEEEQFDLGGGVMTDAPGQSGVAGHDCNCRCQCLHILMDDQEFFEATGRHFPDYIETISNIFDKKNSCYISNDGKFDEDAALTDYKIFLESAPEKNKAILEYALKITPFKETNNPKIVFAYRHSDEAVLYNTRSGRFGDFSFNTAATHELAHRIDDMFGLTMNNDGFAAAILKSEHAMQKSMSKFIDYSWDEDEEGFISDIFSAISKSGGFAAGHDAEYWEVKGNREKEVYANIFSLETKKDVKKLKFLQENFPEIMDEYHRIEFEV